MKIQTYEQRILIPEENHLLCNHEAKVVSDKVYLGINANAEDWVEITLEEAEALQQVWESEVKLENE